MRYWNSVSSYRHCPDASTMLVHSLRRWPNIVPTLLSRLAFGEKVPQRAPYWLRKASRNSSKLTFPSPVLSALAIIALMSASDISSLAPAFFSSSRRLAAVTKPVLSTSIFWNSCLSVFMLKTINMKWNEWWGFRKPLCTYRLNWARINSWECWDEWDDTSLQTQDSKFKPWSYEAKHATFRSRRHNTDFFTSGWGRSKLRLKHTIAYC